jgi:hypothetical protein
MGYFDDQSGILRRYRRERDGWDAHLQRTRDFALQAAAKAERHDSAIVLGSGWLLDVPLKELSAMFGKVTLVDVRHPFSVRCQARKLGNVELQTCDISGFAMPVYRYVRKYRNKRQPPVPNIIQPQGRLELSGYDFVFSCNLLSQLDILLTDYLLRFFRFDEATVITFLREVQRLHIESLPKQRSCLVTDFEEKTYAANGVELGRKPLVYHPIIGRTDACRWRWLFDSAMTYYPDKKTSFEVLAVEL